MTREELIATGARITELRSEIARLVGFQKELKRLEAMLDEITGTPTAGATRLKGAPSIEERAAGFLARNSDRDWSAEQVAAELGTKVPTTRAAFSKLRKANRITNTGNSRVQAIQTPVLPGESREENSGRIELVA